MRYVRRVTRFVFEYEDESGDWQVLGTAQGSGDETHLADALKDLQENEREELRAGRYRYRPDDDSTERSTVFTLDASGHVHLLP